MKEWTWNEIAHRISTLEGKPISRSRCQWVAKRALKKLREALADDSFIQTWLEDEGIGVDSDHEK